MKGKKKPDRSFVAKVVVIVLIAAVVVTYSITFVAYLF